MPYVIGGWSDDSGAVPEHRARIFATVEPRGSRGHVVEPLVGNGQSFEVDVKFVDTKQKGDIGCIRSRRWVTFATAIGLGATGLGAVAG